MLPTKKLNITRVRNRYYIFHPHLGANSNSLLDGNPKLWSRGRDGSPLWTKIAESILDQPAGDHFSKMQQVGEFIKHNHLDLFSHAENINTTDTAVENVLKNDKNSAGKIYFHQNTALDMDITLGGIHVNLINTIRKSTVINLLTLQHPKMDTTQKYFNKFQLDNISTITPFRTQHKNIPDMIQSKLWAPEITRNNLRYKITNFNDAINRENLISERFNDIYNLAAIAEQFSSYNEIIEIYLWITRFNEFNFNETLLTKIFQEALIIKNSKAIY